ncbi:MAG: glycosyltransferase, partial [Xenococcus sp. (in: cyanobacteria)]
AYYNLGTIYQDEGKLEEAAIFFKKGLTLLNKYYAEAIGREDKNQSLVPKVAQGEVKIGDYTYPKIPSLTEQEKQEAKRPFWSVVIPAYKRQEYLLECLASVLIQWEGADNMEIIVVDNGSEPPLQKLVESIGKGIVRYYRHPQTIKLQENWNSAVASSRGEWVHLLHDDDYVLPQFYLRLREGLEGLPNKVGAAFTSYYNVDEQRKPQWPQLYTYNKGAIFDWSLKIGVSCPVIPPSIVIRRSVYENIGGYNTEITFTTDWEIYMRIASFYDAYYEPEVLVHYRRHQNTVSAELMNVGLHAKAYRYAIEVSESYLPPKYVKQISKQAREYLVEMLFVHMNHLTTTRNIRAALELLREIIKVNSSPEALEKVFTWLNTKPGKPLREEIAQQLTKISLSEIEHNLNFVNP